MFNLSGSEMIFLLLIALVVLGPEKLPEAVRRFGKAYGEFKKMTTGFQSELRSALDEPMKEMRDTADAMRKAANFDFNLDPEPEPAVQRYEGWDDAYGEPDEEPAAALDAVATDAVSTDAVSTDAVSTNADATDAVTADAMTDDAVTVDATTAEASAPMSFEAFGLRETVADEARASTEAPAHDNGHATPAGPTPTGWSTLASTPPAAMLTTAMSSAPAVQAPPPPTPAGWNNVVAVNGSGGAGDDPAVVPSNDEVTSG